MSAEEQTEKLANYIMKNFPNDIKDGGAGDVAISIIKRLHEENKILNQKIGRYSNRVWEISEENYKLAERSKRLITDMIKGI